MTRSTVPPRLIHLAFCMQVYDVLPFQVGPFLQSGLVPLVLAPIWVLYAYLQPLLDNLWPGVGFLHWSPAAVWQSKGCRPPLFSQCMTCAMFIGQRCMVSVRQSEVPIIHVCSAPRGFVVW